MTLVRYATKGIWRWPTDVAPGPGSRRAKAWSAEEIRRVRELTQIGYSAAEIARQLNRTVKAVRFKARRHGVIVS